MCVLGWTGAQSRMDPCLSPVGRDSSAPQWASVIYTVDRDVTTVVNSQVGYEPGLLSLGRVPELLRHQDGEKHRFVDSYTTRPSPRTAPAGSGVHVAASG